MSRAIRRWVAILAMALPGLSAPAEPSSGRQAAQEALKPYGALVGSWKGVGQPQRSSSKGAWIEKAAWSWKLSQDDAALELSVERGKWLKSARLTRGTEPGSFVLTAVMADDGSRSFSGRPKDHQSLVLTAEGEGSEGVRRITIRPLHETRFTLLLEGRDPSGSSFFRLAEVGYTREGVTFAAGDSHPTCIVTQGRGTIQVKYQGKTYWVCCSGCKELFEADPAAMIAEAAERDKSKAK
jgi:YHS domain-containing protein